jgi:hypothetical protein
MATPAEAFSRLLGILDKLEIPYSVGGSVASSFHGVPRMTMHVDLVTDLRRDQADELVALLHPDFYVDASAISDAIIRGLSFNVIHVASAYKFDLFPLRKDEYGRAEFERRHFAGIRIFGPEPIECAVATAEDTILRKLEWYRAGGETSERQWNDVRGIRKVSGAKLDLAYMRHWARYVEVDDLLERLLSE